MFEKVLVPIDFSEFSNKIPECICGLPGVEDVVLLHVVSRDPMSLLCSLEDQLKDAKARIEKQKRYLDTLGFNIRFRTKVVVNGDISRAIQSIADNENASLIAIGAYGMGFVKGLLLGSVSENLLLHGHTNLLIIRYKMLEGQPIEKYCHSIFYKVLCPTDFSSPSMDAISFIKGLDRVGEIILFHVVSLMQVVSLGETTEKINLRVQEATDRLNAIQKEIEKSGQKARVYVQVGVPYEEINILADKEDVSLVAMSSHGMGWLQKILVGSTTYKVARNANRPVLVVRTKRMS